MHLYSKLEMDVFMFNNKGMTLIESLFAFEIFVVVVVTLLSMINVSMSQEARLNQHYQTINQKEVSLSYSNDFTSLIKEALR